MSMTAPWGLATVPDEDQGRLDITLPAAKQTFKVTSAQLKTELTLEPRMQVSVIATGYISKIALDFLGDDNAGAWTVTLDEVKLSEIGQNTP